MSIDGSPYDKLQHPIVQVKREQRGKFVTEAAFDILARKLDKLESLPRNLSEAVSKTFSNMSEDLSRSTITKNEFASFQLVVARDTSHIRVRYYYSIKFVLFPSSSSNLGRRMEIVVHCPQSSSSNLRRRMEIVQTVVFPPPQIWGGG